LEEKFGVGVTLTVQSDERVRGQVNRATETVGSGRVSFPSNFDIHSLVYRAHSVRDRSRVGKRHVKGESSGIGGDAPPVLKCD
jgi:hypothetical protein